jgi:hypothetical protein
LRTVLPRLSARQQPGRVVELATWQQAVYAKGGDLQTDTDKVTRR